MRSYGGPAILLLAVGFWLIYRSAVAPAGVAREGPLKEGDWVYVPTGTSAPPKIDGATFEALQGRPGKIIAEEGMAAKVDYEPEANPDWDQAAGKVVANGNQRTLPPFSIPVSDLRRCPPQQQGIDDNSTGVVRMWIGDELTPLDQQTDHDARVGDTVTVEIKDFDRWLFEQFDFGRLQEELDSVPEDLATEIKAAVKARRSVELLEGLKRVNELLRSDDMRGELFVPPDEQAKAAQYEKVIRAINSNTVLLAIEAKIHGELSADKPLDARIKALDERFLPARVWISTVTEKKFRQLTFKVNGVVLPGITPGNAYNAAEQMHQTRPSYPEDFYQWGRFKLTRMDAREKVAGQESTLSRQNQAAWFELIGKPSFHLPCHATLSLPDGLDLKSKVTIDNADPECRFFLVGIERWKFWATLAVFAAFLAFLVWLAMTTDILRDASGHVRPDGFEPVSLGRTQMAFWFLLTTGAYAFLWVTTGNYDTINDTCLVLLGIGSATALGSALIETSAPKFLITAPLNRPREAVQADIANAIIMRLQKLMELLGDAGPAVHKQFIALLHRIKDDEAGAPDKGSAPIEPLLESAHEKWKLKGKLSAAPALADPDQAIIDFARSLKSQPQRAAGKPASMPNPESDLETVAGELELLGLQSAQFKQMAPTRWKRLCSDWLSEGNSTKYSFHRFQVMAWTVLLGYIFVWNVLRDRAMPEFNSTTLSLLGISAGTYLGFKIPGAKQEAGKKE
jgi:hypothetical protein